MMRITIVGNLGADASARYTDSGTASTMFDVAVNSRVRASDGEFEERTDWFRVRTIGNRATYAAQLEKGQRVLIVGRLTIGEWTSQTTGEIKTGYTIWADDIVNLEGRTNGRTESREASARQTA